MGELYRQLEVMAASDLYPFHMPGHKRSPSAGEGRLAGIYGMDITEIDGFDNLHQPRGILKEIQNRAADLYGADHSWLLVNGSTCGILAAILASTERGSKLLMGRNCHKSVYHGVLLQGLQASYLYPDMIPGWEAASAIAPEKVEERLKAEPEITAVLITSPTYEGIVSDITSIAEICHAYGKPLIVDEAHGAHFGYAPEVPGTAVRQGADLVIQSLHKTMPSMTQTALLHLCGERIARERVERYLGILQTSSPSYVLMASMEQCLDLAEKEGRQRLKQLFLYRESMKQRLSDCRLLRILEVPGADPCKLVIGSKDGRISGWQLYDRLRETYHLQMEMASDSYVLAILSMMDTREGLDRLAQALWEIDQELRCVQEAVPQTPAGVKNVKKATKKVVLQEMTGTGQPSINFMEHMQEEPWNREKEKAFLTIAEACEQPWEEIPLAEAEGRISAEFVGLYPPGIPWAVPGEELSGEMVQRILRLQEDGRGIQGVQKGKIKVVRQEQDEILGKV